MNDAHYCPIRQEWCTAGCEWYDDETNRCCVRDIAAELRKLNRKKG